MPFFFLEQTHVVYWETIPVKFQSVLDCACLNRCLFPFFKAHVLKKQVKECSISWRRNTELGIVCKMGIVLFAEEKMMFSTSHTCPITKFGHVFLADS